MSRAGLLRAILLLVALASLTWFLASGGSSPRDAVDGDPYPGGTVTAACRGGAFRVVDARTQVMGTRFILEVAAPDEATGRAACRQAFLRIHALERGLSTWIPESTLSRVNREAARAPVRVDEDCFEVLRLAGRVHEASGGAFDPSIGPLLEVWRPLARLERLPTEAEVAAARSRVGYFRVALHPEERAVSFPQEGMALDLGGIAKGYAAEIAAREARSAGATACRVNAGGDVYALGGPPWNPLGFEVRVRDPLGGEADALPGRTFFLRDAAAATSGNYERYTEAEGKRYSHILDPRTGRPVPDAVVQVTAVGRGGARIDAWATALTVLGAREGLALAESRADLEALFLVREGEELRQLATSRFPGGAR